MKLFDQFNAERHARYADAGIAQPIARSKRSYFFSFGNQFTLDTFQSTQDFKNDLQAVFIKPLTCLFLSWYHHARFLYEFGLTAVHLVTFSPDTNKHAEKMIESFVNSFLYKCMLYIETITQTLNFLMRTTLSIGAGVYRAGAGLVHAAPEKQTAPSFAV